MQITRGARIIITAFVLAQVFLLTSGCVFNSGAKVNTDIAGTKINKTKVKLRYAHLWGGSEGIGKYFRDKLDEFLTKNSNWIELEQEISNGDEIRSKIEVDAAGDNLPDVFNFIGRGMIVPYVNQGLILDMDEYFKYTKTLKKDDFNDNIWEVVSVGGKAYGIPIQGFKGVFICNRDLFEKYGVSYPKTYEDMKNVARVFIKNGIVPLNVGSKGGNPSHFWFSEMYYQYKNGPQEIENLGKTWKFNTENAFKVANLIDEQRKSGIFPEDTMKYGDWGPSLELYNSEKAAMSYSFSFTLGQMKPEIEAKSVLIPVPKMPGGVNDPSLYYSGGCNQGIFINRKSFQDPVKRDALIALVDFLASDEMAIELAEKAGVVPVKNNIVLRPEKTMPMLTRLLEYTDKIHNSYYTHFDYLPDSKIMDLYQLSLDELWAGAVTPEQFVNKIQKAMDKIKIK